MNTRYWTRKLHRWIGIAVVLQLLAWTAGGLYFSLIPIREIRGEHLVSKPGSLSTAELAGVVAPGALTATLGQATIEGIELLRLGSELRYKVYTAEGVRALDARTGSATPALTAAQAEAIAKASLIPDAPVSQVRLIEAVDRGDEYRDLPLPAWQVTFDHASGIRLYVAQNTGEVTARRTDRWRIFDFLWMLHVMDYQDRDDFNHPLLTLAASVALFALLSGILMWWQTTGLRKTIRPQPRQE